MSVSHFLDKLLNAVIVYIIYDKKLTIIISEILTIHRKTLLFLVKSVIIFIPIWVDTGLLKSRIIDGGFLAKTGY